MSECAACGGNSFDHVPHACMNRLAERVAKLEAAILGGEPRPGGGARATATAPDQGAPAEPLSARMRGYAPWMSGLKLVNHSKLLEWADEVAALESRLAAAERERDEATAKERARCLAWAKGGYMGTRESLMSVESIRDGRPAPTKETT